MRCPKPSPARQGPLHNRTRPTISSSSAAWIGGARGWCASLASADTPHSCGATQAVTLNHVASGLAGGPGKLSDGRHDGPSGHGALRDGPPGLCQGIVLSGEGDQVQQGSRVQAAIGNRVPVEVPEHMLSASSYGPIKASLQAPDKHASQIGAAHPRGAVFWIDHEHARAFFRLLGR
jgi:hypothetical protein